MFRFVLEKFFIFILCLKRGDGFRLECMKVAIFYTLLSILMEHNYNHSGSLYF